MFQESENKLDRGFTPEDPFSTAYREGEHVKAPDGTGVIFEWTVENFDRDRKEWKLARKEGGHMVYLSIAEDDLDTYNHADKAA